MKRCWILPLLLLLGCGGGESAPAEPEIAIDNDRLASRYVVLELAMGEIDSNHVDAYSGPEVLREQARDAGWLLDDIDDKASRLATLLTRARDTENVQRVDGLLERLTALRTRVAINQGTFLPFDDEARALFGVSAPDYDAGHFEEILARIDDLLPGKQPLPARVDEFRNRFMIPDDKVARVFEAALDECRRRTQARIVLPADESFSLEYVNDKPWTGYNWYQGDAKSLIQVNRDFPMPISRAVDLGCHEGYPGHHTYNALLEKALKQDRGWVEFSLYPLFSPQSLIAEGSGNYGIDLVFPGDERIVYEQDVLFPLAGLDASEADRYYQLLALLEGLSYADNEAARDYLNGKADKQQTIEFLVNYALSSPERAEQRVRFFDTYRSYVINYNLGKDLVRNAIEADDADTDLRWQRFTRLLSEPVSAKDL